MTTLTCDHGYFKTDCALCEKRPGECDYGSCTEKTTTSVATLNARGVELERRPMCAKHGAS